MDCYALTSTMKQSNGKPLFRYSDRLDDGTYNLGKFIHRPRLVQASVVSMRERPSAPSHSDQPRGALWRSLRAHTTGLPLTYCHAWGNPDSSRLSTAHSVSFTLPYSHDDCA